MGYSDPRMYRQGDWETDPVLWRNAQWAVTEYGIENVAGPYHYYIPGPNFEEWWPDHMSEKNWVDQGMFKDCYDRAARIHAARKATAGADHED
jgi:hypothetical protein